MRRAEMDRVVRARTAAHGAEGKRLREQVGLTQAEVASVCGVTHAAVARWESGDRRPRGKAAVKYGELLERLSGAEQAT